jgi:hypothetical protein
MSPSLKIAAADIVKDIRSGLTDAAIMAKYNISGDALQRALKQLVDEGFISRAEFDWRPTEYYDSVIIQNFRRHSRIALNVRLPIIDANDPAAEGVVRDISEKGVRTMGIQAEVNDVRSLVVLADELARIDPFGFEACCRWAGKDRGTYLAGFEIIDISEKSLSDLKELIHALSTNR